MKQFFWIFGLFIFSQTVFAFPLKWSLHSVDEVKTQILNPVVRVDENQSPWVVFREESENKKYYGVSVITRDDKTKKWIYDAKLLSGIEVVSGPSFAMNASKVKLIGVIHQGRYLEGRFWIQKQRGKWQPLPPSPVKGIDHIDVALSSSGIPYFVSSHSKTKGKLSVYRLNTQKNLWVRVGDLSSMIGTQSSSLSKIKIEPSGRTVVAFQTLKGLKVVRYDAEKDIWRRVGPGGTPAVGQGSSSILDFDLWIFSNFHYLVAFTDQLRGSRTYVIESKDNSTWNQVGSHFVSKNVTLSPRIVIFNGKVVISVHENRHMKVYTLKKNQWEIATDSVQSPSPVGIGFLSISGDSNGTALWGAYQDNGNEDRLSLVELVE
tara:strand:- start:1867 stop:2994 length:1128 start_codon:yes stop_codon:yes gene_type:complete